MNLWKLHKGPEDYFKKIDEFHYEPSVGEIFVTWYARSQNVYENQTAGLLDEIRITMLFQKFNKNDRDLYLVYLLPLPTKDLTFGETIRKCEKVFGDKTSLFNGCYRCLNLAIRKGEDIHKTRAL